MAAHLGAARKSVLDRQLIIVHPVSDEPLDRRSGQQPVDVEPPSPIDINRPTLVIHPEKAELVVLQDVSNLRKIAVEMDPVHVFRVPPFRVRDQLRQGFLNVKIIRPKKPVQVKGVVSLVVRVQRKPIGQLRDLRRSLLLRPANTATKKMFSNFQIVF